MSEAPLDDAVLRKGRDEPEQPPGHETAVRQAELSRRPNRHQRPYPGLRPFFASERRFFFGRDEQIADIIERLEKSHFAAIVGGSGSGKSSILRAGVIPELRVKRIAGRGDFWLIVDFTPEDEPFHKLARALDRVLVRIGPEETESRIRDIEDTLIETGSIAGFLKRYRDQLYLEEGQAPDSRQYANLLVFCDQFEEIFRDENRNSVQASQLVDLFVEAFENRSSYDSLFLVIGMRSEDLHRCSAYMGLPGVINESSYLTRRLNEKEIEESILEPARELLLSKNVIPSDLGDHERDSWPFDGQLLRRIYDEIDRLAHDPDHLPLLQHLLSFLWRNCGARLLWLRRTTFSLKDPRARITEADLATALKFPSVKALDESLAASEDGLFARCLNHAANEALARSTDGHARSRLRGGAALPVPAAAQESRAPEPADETGVEASKVDPHEAARTTTGAEIRGDTAEVRTGQARRATTAQRRAVEFMFRLLAEVDDRGNYKRRWTNRDEIKAVCGASDDSIDTIISAFTKPYPFLHVRSGRSGNIDVSHESFIRNWSQFRSWLENEREIANCFEAARKEYKRAKDRRDATSGFLTRMRSRLFDRLDKERLRELSPWWSARGSNDAWADRYAEGIAEARTEAEIEKAKEASRQLLPGLRRFYKWSIRASWFRVGLLTAICSVAIVSLLGILANTAKLDRTQLEADYLTPFAIAVGVQQEILGSPVGPQSEARLVEALYALRTAEGIAREQRETSLNHPLSLRTLTSWYLPPPNEGVTEIVRQVNDNATRLIFSSLLWRTNKTAVPGYLPQSVHCGSEALQEVTWENPEVAPPATSYRVLREALAPLEGPNGRRLAALGSEGVVHFALLPPDGQPCSLRGARYVGGVGTPPNSAVAIDPEMRVIVANETTNGGPRAWVYRLRWLRNCREDVRDGKCKSIQFAQTSSSAVVVSGQTLKPLDRTTLSGQDGSIWSLRWDDQPELVDANDHELAAKVKAAFARNEDPPNPGNPSDTARTKLPSGDVRPRIFEPRCVKQGRYGAIVRVTGDGSARLEYTLAVAEARPEEKDPCRPGLADEDIIMKMRFVAPTLDDLAFGEETNGRLGPLFLRGAEKALVYSLAWHPDDLAGILCSEIKNMQGGKFRGYTPPSTPGRPQFSNPFERMAKPEESIIRRTRPCD